MIHFLWVGDIRFMVLLVFCMCMDLLCALAKSFVDDDFNEVDM
jgi:hypothetical protein